MKKIIINKLDYLRIKQSISNAKQSNRISAFESEKLVNELESAEIIEPEKIPSNVLTMNSKVKGIFLNSRQHLTFQIVYPHQAHLKKIKFPFFRKWPQP
ncbi:MAG TPA: hypothetical protein PKN41_05795 [Bacteroidales bacterium]|nr:hypothetical protein [Bacteroidales bacterium]